MAPLQTRRDIACLGLIHRAVLGVGPPHFREWFFPSRKLPHQHDTRLRKKQHNKQLHDYIDGNHNELLRRSILGLPQVYNTLPQKVVDTKSVRSFQRALQQQVKENLLSGKDGWEHSLNLRKVSFAG